MTRLRGPLPRRSKVSLLDSVFGMPSHDKDNSCLFLALWMTRLRGPLPIADTDVKKTKE
jgi:hypothetical protein